MRIGIYNIFTTFWFFIMLLCSGLLAYQSFSKELYMSDVNMIAKIVIVIITLIFFCILIYLLYKFRILITYKNLIISVNPFLLKIVKIDILEIKSVKWTNFTAFKSTTYKMVEIKDINSKIEITDLEFENFETLVQNIEKDKVRKLKIDIEQAKSNNWNEIFNTFLLSGFLIFLIIITILNKAHFLLISFILINIVLLCGTLKRLSNYRKIIKNYT